LPNQVIRIPTVYSERMVVEIDHYSPSAKKPRQVAEALKTSAFPILWTEPEPASVTDFCRVHDPDFVKGTLMAALPNGFGTYSEEVARTLPYTTGAMMTAARLALQHGFASALVSGFHHAGCAYASNFCTFNGLMVTAKALIEEGLVQRVAIIDADQHYGDGTEDILDIHGWHDEIFHYSFGKDFHQPEQASLYLDRMTALTPEVQDFAPNLILYQAGADTHVDDPLGGVLTTDELLLRDYMLFKMARQLSIPVAWNLAGGYQRDPDGGISKVIEIHLNTFRAAIAAMSDDEVRI
jgi:acetoin utilization deacetylase AcuC-like enzyme